MSGIPFNREPFLSDLIPFIKEKVKEEWQHKWNCDEMGRFPFSIIPSVSFKSFFKNIHWNRREVQILCRIVSNHTRLRHHLGRINILNDMLCSCEKDYDSVDHKLWFCQLFDSVRPHMYQELRKLNVLSPVPTRDLCGFKMFNVLRICIKFLVDIGIEI